MNAFPISTALARRLLGLRLPVGAVITAALGAGVLAACQMALPGGAPGQSPTELAEATTEWRVVPNQRAYINVPGALIVMERDLGTAIEQRITLPNSTALPGENIIMLRAQTSRSASATRFVLADTLAQFGGAPAPFGDLTETSLKTVNDGYGTVTYATRNVGTDTLCVLALRRSDIGGRALPRRTSSLDLMLRHCVTNGSTDAALAPIGPGAFRLGGGF